MIDNKTAFEYSKESAEAFNYLAQPIFKAFKAHSLVYCKILSNGKRIYLATNKKWLQTYIENKFYDNEKHSYQYAPDSHIKYSVWSSFEEDEIVNACYSLNHYHGFSLHNYNSEKGYFEYLDINTSIEDHSLPNRCLNDLNTLNQYVEKLKKDAQFLFNHEDKRKLLTSKVPLSLLKM